jgi:hypothetical protein
VYGGSQAIHPEGTASLELLELIAKPLVAACSAAGADTQAGRPTPYHSARVPPISVPDYLIRIAKHTRVSAVAFVLAVCYIRTACQARWGGGSKLVRVCLRGP